MARFMTAASIGVCALVALWALCALSGCSGLQELEGLVVEDVALQSVADGDYVGVQRNFPVTAKVRVTVQSGRITAIDVRRHFHGPGHGAATIAEQVLARQTLEVDAISGATYSSKVILKAIQSALEKGL